MISRQADHLDLICLFQGHVYGILDLSMVDRRGISGPVSVQQQVVISVLLAILPVLLLVCNETDEVTILHTMQLALFDVSKMERRQLRILVILLVRQESIGVMLKILVNLQVNHVLLRVLRVVRL